MHASFLCSILEETTSSAVLQRPSGWLSRALTWPATTAASRSTTCSPASSRLTSCRCPLLLLLLLLLLLPLHAVAALHVGGRCDPFVCVLS